MTRYSRALAVVGAVFAAAVGAATIGASGAAAQSSVSSPVRFVESALHVVEGRGPVQVVVERTDLPVSRLLVHYRTEDGGSPSTPGAVAGSDYAHTAGTLVFEVGVQSSSFTVVVRDDEVAEETEHLLLHLETSSGSRASTRLTVLDDDVAPPSPAAGSASAPIAPPRPTPARSSVAAPPAPPPVVVASSAGARRPVATPRTRSRVAAARPAPPRRITLQQTPTTPFELRPSGRPDGAPGLATAVDPLLALGAGLLLARVAAEAWFRARIAAR